VKIVAIVCGLDRIPEQNSVEQPRIDNALIEFPANDVLAPLYARQRPVSRPMRRPSERLDSDALILLGGAVAFSFQVAELSVRLGVITKLPSGRHSSLRSGPRELYVESSIPDRFRGERRQA
jgi:hypothetical protein